MQTQPKILIEAERMRYPNSGIASVCRSLIKGLTEVSDVDFTVFGPHEVQKDLKVKNWLPWRNLHRVFQPSLVEYEVVHVTHQLCRFFHQTPVNTKKIVTLHDLNYLYEYQDNIKVSKRHNLVQKNIGNADAIVFISHFAKQDFLKNADKFSLKKDLRLEVIHNGIIFPEKVNAEPAFDHLIRSQYILSIGVLFPKKNQIVLLPLLVGNEKKLVLIASDSKNDYEEKFWAEAEKLGVKDRIEILKNVSENEKYLLLKHCESLCHPSLAEGFGIPPVEAMFFGKPVFLSRLTSLPEVGGHLATYFDSFEDEDMVRIYQHGITNFQENALENSKKHKNWASQYSYQEMARKYYQLYIEMACYRKSN